MVKWKIPIIAFSLIAVVASMLFIIGCEFLQGQSQISPNNKYKAFITSPADSKKNNWIEVKIEDTSTHSEIRSVRVLFLNNSPVLVPLRESPHVLEWSQDSSYCSVILGGKKVVDFIIQNEKLNSEK